MQIDSDFTIICRMYNKLGMIAQARLSKVKFVLNAGKIDPVSAIFMVKMESFEPIKIILIGN